MRQGSRANGRVLTAIAIAAAAALPAAHVALSQTELTASPTGINVATEGNRGPYEVAFTRDGTRAVVTEFDEGALAIIDRASGKVLNHVSTGGLEPTGVAVTPDGALALVTNSFSGSLAFVDLKALKTATLPLPGSPYDVVISPDGMTAYVSVSLLDQVAVVDIAARKVVARMPAGRRPRALDLTPDGRVLVAGNMTQGSVTFYNTATRQEIGDAPTPAVNLRGVAVYPNGRVAYAVAQRAQNERPTETAIGIWSNQSFHLVPNGGINGAENIWLDFIGKDVSDPDSVVLDARRNMAFMTCSGGHSVLALPLRGANDGKTIPTVGAVPKGLALTPDGKELWVCNSLSNDVAVINPDTLTITRRISLGPTMRKDPHLRGKFLFDTATIVNGAQFSCASCHPDGHTDGIAWKFVHVPDPLGKKTDRNVRSLRGEIGDTAPFRWSGHDKNLEDFINEELVGLLQGPKLAPKDVAAMTGYIKSLRLYPNPYRSANGALTPEAERGKLMFDGKAGCIKCHAGPKSGATRRAYVGTTPTGMELDVPHLAGVYDSYPYLHDGSALTLEDIFRKRNPQKLHGSSDTLTPAEQKDLIEYVRQL